MNAEVLANECTAQYESGSSSPLSDQRSEHDENGQRDAPTFDVMDELDVWDVLEVLEHRPVASDDVDIRHALAIGGDLTPSTPPQSAAAAAPATPAKSARPKAKRAHVSCDGAAAAAAPPVPRATSAGSSPPERDLSDSGAPSEEKRLKRMRRNRESAAMSRNRKKAYMEDLEAKVNELSATVARLEAENAQLLAQNAELGGAASGPTRATVAAAAAAGPAAVGRKVGAASLALMSALTFVAVTVTPAASLSGNPTMSSHHVPGARALMSLPEERALGFDGRGPPAVAPAKGAAAAALLSAEPAPLWPALSTAAAAAAAAAAASPSPSPASEPAAPQPALLTVSSTRDHTQEARAGGALAPALVAVPVIRLPQNSSWADALRTEAAEQRLLAEQQLKKAAVAEHEASEIAVAASRRRVGSRQLTWPAQTEQRHVYEPDWKDEEEEVALDGDGVVPPLPFGGTELYDDAFADRFSARRFVFCPRAIVYENFRAGVASRGDVAERPVEKLPVAMPARFRHAASQKLPMPALTDGSNSTTELPAAPEPVVSLLLPSAALHGVVAVSDGGRRPPPRTEEGEVPGLVQVTCQLLNATRWS